MLTGASGPRILIETDCAQSAVLVCGGLGGVMEAAARAHLKRRQVLGILP
jgi:predicted Rossmann-fold nucleotide-binding protein